MHCKPCNHSQASCTACKTQAPRSGSSACTPSRAATPGPPRHCKASPTATALIPLPPATAAAAAAVQDRELVGDRCRIATSRRRSTSSSSTRRPIAREDDPRRTKIRQGNTSAPPRGRRPDWGRGLRVLALTRRRRGQRCMLWRQIQAREEPRLLLLSARTPLREGRRWGGPLQPV